MTSTHEVKSYPTNTGKILRFECIADRQKQLKAALVRGQVEVSVHIQNHNGTKRAVKPNTMPQHTGSDRKYTTKIR